MSRLEQLTAVISVGMAQLWFDRSRTALAVIGVVLAVLATTLLAGTGIGVVETGEEKFDAAGRDLWITGGPVRFSPTRVGGIENSITDAHTLAAELGQRPAVRTAAPLLFQTVYVSRSGDDFQTIAAIGLPSSGGLSIKAGTGFGRNDVHYAGGNYTGPMQHEVVVGPRTAAKYNLSINDSLYIGGTLTTAREHRFTVVGISPTNSRFLGSPTVSLPLSELQEITGSTGTDPATLVTIKTQSGVDVQRLERNLQNEYPQYDVRTNREQLEATVQRQAVVLVSGASLVGLAVIAGVALTVNVLFSLMYQQRKQFAALQALGWSTRRVVSIAISQALVIGGLGAAVGIGLSVPVATLLDRIIYSIVGFENVIRLPDIILFIGVGIALGMSLVGAIAASWRVARIEPLQQLR